MSAKGPRLALILVEVRALIISRPLNFQTSVKLVSTNARISNVPTRMDQDRMAYPPMDQVRNVRVNALL